MPPPSTATMPITNPEMAITAIPTTFIIAVKVAVRSIILLPEIKYSFKGIIKKLNEMKKIDF